MYKIKVLPFDEENLGDSRKQVMKDTRHVVRDIIDPLKCDLKKYHRLGRKQLNLISEINSSLFWRSLNSIDGPDYREFDRIHGQSLAILTKDDLKKSKLITRRNQTWARKNFCKFRLYDLLNVAVNQAILKPIPMSETCKPGNDHGHTILYEKLVNKKDSMFREALTPEFIKLLNNGRFWECLHHNGRSSYKHLEDVLNNHFEDLDPNFSERGIFLIKDMDNFKDNDGSMKYLFSSQNNDLIKISKQHAECTFDKYLDFVKLVDEKESLFVEQIDLLLKPYIIEILSWDDDQRIPTYHGSSEFSPGLGYYIEKLKDPFIQRYIEESPDIANVVAKSLYRTIDYYFGIGQDMNNYVTSFVTNILNNVPEMPYMVEKLRQTGREVETTVNENQKVKKVLKIFDTDK